MNTSGKLALWRCYNCGTINSEEISSLKTVDNAPIPRFGWGCDVCHNGRRLFVRRLTIADFNPFGLCQRICDLNLENCGHFCTEPLQHCEWKDFWALIEREWAEQEKKLLYYDPWPDCPLNGCDECEDTDCPQRKQLDEAEYNNCSFTGDECIDTSCRDFCGCVGCEILAPPSKAELESVENE